MRRISVILFYVCVFGGLAEIALRYYFSGVSPVLIQTQSPEKLGEYLPNQSIVFRPLGFAIPPVRVLTNQEGLRLSGSMESENAKDPVAANTKVLCIGDEVTFGLGVPDEETYPSLLKGLLQSRAGTPFQVLNAGVPNYQARDEGLFLKKKMPLISAGTVILQVSSNDLVDVEKGPSAQNSHPSANKSESWELFLKKNLALYNGLLFLLEEARSKHQNSVAPRNIQSPIDFFGEPRDLSQLMREWQKTGDVWQEMCLAIKRSNKNIIVVVVPHPKQMKDGSGVDLYQNPIKQMFSRECQVRVVDPMDKFRQASQATPLYFENSHLLNHAGNLLLAQVLAQEILPQ